MKLPKSARRSEKKVHFNVRQPRVVSGRRRITASAAAVELLDESLRREGFPGSIPAGPPSAASPLSPGPALPFGSSTTSKTSIIKTSRG